MKKILLSLILLFPIFLFSQHSDRVLLIKKMYKETKSYSKDGDGNTKVNDRSGIERIKQNKFRWLNIAVKELNKRK